MPADPSGSRPRVLDGAAFARLLDDAAVQMTPSDGGYPRLRVRQDRSWDTGLRTLNEHLVYVIRRGTCAVRWRSVGDRALDADWRGAAELPSGHAIVLPPGLDFRCFAVGGGEVLMARFRFTVRARGRAIAWTREPHRFPMDSTRERLADLIVDELPRGGSTLLACLTRAFCLAVAADQARAQGLTRDQIAVLTRLIRQQPGTVTPHDLARRLGLGLDWATRLIRRSTGHPPRTWIVHERIRIACSLLDEGLRPSAVADRLGYHDARLFSRQFRAVIGCPPSTWGRRTRRE